MSKKQIEFAPARDSIPLGYETTNLERNSVDQHASQEYPEGGLAAWLVVAGSFSMLACTFGMMSSVGVLQSYWETHQLQAYTSSTVGWVSAVFLFLNLSLGLQVGPLFDRYGPQWIMICGSVLYALSIFLLGNCNKYYEFMLCLGVLGGSSSAFVSTPSLSVLSHWFQRRRGTAIGIAMTGSSLGGIIFPLMLRATLERFGWAWALRVLGFIFIFFLTMGNICIRSRESSLHKKPKGTVDLQCFADSRFVWATLGVFFSEIVLFASLGLIPTYALAQGFDSQTGFYLSAVFNGGSGFGRWLSGVLSDRCGSFNTISFMMLLTAIFLFVLWYPFGHFLGVLYSVTAIMGFGTGSILSLTPVCLGHLCKTEEFGKWVGTCYFAGSFGTLVAIPISGQLLEVAGPSRLVGFIGGVLGVSIICFCMARWACLEYHWKWICKV